MEHYTYEIQLYCQKKESETYRNIYSFKWRNDTDKNSLFWRYFIIPNNTLRLNDIIGNEKLLPCNVWNDKTVPILRTRIEPIKIEEREKLLDALTEIADTDPLLRYYVDTITHEIIISF